MPPMKAPRRNVRLLQPEAVGEIRRAYRELARRLGVTDPPVAVRSSAAAEDLPGASFAGQYETYLHVRGEADVLAHTMRCWESLRSEHALAYRRYYEQRSGTALPPAMAVLVQTLVEAEAAGVAFTAHPTTGDRSCVLVNAGWGSGSRSSMGRWRRTPTGWTGSRWRSSSGASGGKQRGPAQGRRPHGRRCRSTCSGRPV